MKLQILGLLYNSGFSQFEIEKILSINLNISLADNPEFKVFLKPYLHLGEILNQANFLQFVLKQLEYKNSIKELLRKSLTYPAILICTAVISLFLFKYSLLPSLTKSISILTEAIDYSIFYLILDSIILIIFMFILLAFFISILWSKRIYRLVVFHFIKNRKIFSIQLEYLSIEFVSILHPLLDLGLSTKQCFEAMHLLKDNWLITSISYQIITALETGKELNTIINELPFANDLKQFMIIGITTGRLLSLLNQYQMIKRIQLQSSIAKFAKGVQIIAYILITAILFLLYQIIFSPINILFQL